MLDSLLPNEILALTIYGEARGESVEGQIAVANVIMNRKLANPIKYKNLRDVCLEPLQFSCWNENDPNRATLLDLATNQIITNNVTNIALKQCLWISDGIANKMAKDNTNKAKNYMTKSLFDSDNRPSWAKDPKNTPIQIGNHVFFNV